VNTESITNNSLSKFEPLKDNLKALDGLRGLSAIYVLVHHARLALTQPYFNGLSRHPEQYQWYDRIMVYFFSLFKFGHEAVIIFFVLSGFLIHFRYAGAQNIFVDFKLSQYLKKRLIRIYPTLIVSFIVCYLTDFIILIVTGDSYPLSQYSISRFLFNFFLVPESPLWGSNYPVWSLKHEWFFYLMYPLLLWSYHKQRILPLLLSLGLFFTYLFGYKIDYIGAAAYTISIWLLGAIMAAIYKQNKRLFNYIPVLIVFFLAYPLIARINSNYPWLDLCFGLITTGFVALMIIRNKSMLAMTLSSLSWLGTFSYSLYLLHFPILLLFKALAIYYAKNKELPYHLWYVTGSIIIIIPFVYLIYYYSERIALNYKKRI